MTNNPEIPILSFPLINLYILLVSPPWSVDKLGNRQAINFGVGQRRLLGIAATGTVALILGIPERMGRGSRPPGYDQILSQSRVCRPQAQKITADDGGCQLIRRDLGAING